jgi:drug/metabolite transporter (DMT)-like permease
MSTFSSQRERNTQISIRAIIAVVCTIVSWAAAFPFIRLGLQGLSPMQLAAARFATAAILVVCWLIYAKPKRPSMPHLALFALSGFLGIASYNALLNTAELTVAPGAAAFIMSTSPIFTAILARIFLQEKLNGWGWLGSLFSFAGIGLIAQGQPDGLVPGSGATLILLAAAASAAYFVLQRRLIPVYGPLASTAYTLLAGALLLSPWLPGAFHALAAPSASVGTREAVLILGVFPAALGYATWTIAIGHFGATRVANFLYLLPALATALSMWLTGERPGSMTITGGLIAVAGVAFVAARGRA